MYYGCPKKSCKSHGISSSVVKDGFYWRREDSRSIQRFKCKSCALKFSRSTFNLAYKQKKRRVNHKIFQYLSSGLSIRRTARLLNVHQITVSRKIRYLSKKAALAQGRFLKDLSWDQVMHLQFDDLITIEHTKMKPLTVTLAVDAKRRFILDAQVASIPAFGLLAKKSREKYGIRPNHHPLALKRLFSKIKDVVHPNAKIESDEHKSYPSFVKRNFPHANYHCYPGGRGCIAGQGELKKKHFDPLFTLNHSCAMLRANINRLIRKTWCSTKNPAMLKHHLNIYLSYHNQELLKLA